MYLKFIVLTYIWTCMSQTVQFTKNFDPSGGAVADGTVVSLAADTGAIICVTRWEEMPVCNSQFNGCLTGFLYSSSSPLTKLKADEGWKWYAVACKSGSKNSPIISTQNIWGSLFQATPVVFSPTGLPQDQDITLSTSVPSGSGNYVICYAENDLPYCTNGTGCDAGIMYKDSSKPRVTSTTFGKTWVAIVCTDSGITSDYSYQYWGQLSYPYVTPSGGSYPDNTDVNFLFPPNYVVGSGHYFCVGTDMSVNPVCDVSNKKCSVGTLVDGNSAKMTKYDSSHNGKRWVVKTCPPDNTYTESPLYYTGNWESSTKIPAPVFYPDGGFVEDPVTIAVSPSDALICYNNADAAIPKCSASMTSCDVGTKYDPAARIPVSLLPAGKLRAVACKSGYATDSAVGTHTYAWSIDSQIYFDPNGGIVAEGQVVTLSTVITDSIICYSTDPDSYPTCNYDGTSCSSGTKYSSTSKPTITAAMFNSYWVAVPCKSPYDYTSSKLWNVMPMPAFVPDSGSLNDNSPINFASMVSGTIICYIADTTEQSPNPTCPSDLSEPTCTLGTKYDSTKPPMKTMDNTVWKAIACRKGSIPSPVAYATYWKNSAAPSFVQNGGSLPDNQPVTINGLATSLICYSKKGDLSISCNSTTCLSGSIKYDPANKPTKSSSDNTQFWTAVACEKDKEPSPVIRTKGAWNNKVIAPVFEPDGGPMLDKNRVQITSETIRMFSTDTVICMCFNDCTDGPKCKSDGKSCESSYTTYNDKNRPQFIKSTHDNKKWKAIACKSGMVASEITTTTNAWNQILKPRFLPDGGAINIGSNVFITSSPGATICYGQDSALTCTPPTTGTKGTCTKSSNFADTPPKITANDLKTNWYAVACKSGYTTSSRGQTTYIWRDPNTIVPPNFNPNGGKVADGTPISIDSDIPDAVVCYTLGTTTTPACLGDNTGCAIGLTYDASNKPLKAASHNGLKWQARVCDKVLGPSTIAISNMWEKYVASSITNKIPVTLLVLSLMSIVIM